MDHLIGLKENVIIGKPIPAGTGMKRYRQVKLDSELAAPEDELVLSGEEDELDSINEDNVAEEVLDIDDTAESVEEAAAGEGDAPVSSENDSEPEAEEGSQEEENSEE